MFESHQVFNNANDTKTNKVASYSACSFPANDPIEDRYVIFSVSMPQVFQMLTLLEQSTGSLSLLFHAPL